MSAKDASREIGQLHEPLRYLNTHAQKKREEVARLQRELAEAEKELRCFDDDYRKTLIYYARTDCLRLATMMYEKLPQELREIVYEYLCVDPDRPIPVGPYYHFRPYDRPYVYPPPSNAAADPDPYLDFRICDESEPETSTQDAPGPHGTLSGWDRDLQVDPMLVQRISSVHIQQDVDNLDLGDNYTILPDGRVKEEHTHRAPSDMVLPSTHFLDPRYVGPAVSYEIQKMYYARNTFSICTVENAISNFLGRHTGYSMLKWVDGLPPRHPPDLGPFPPLFVAEHIRRLQIRVKLEHFLNEKPEREYFSDRYPYEQRFLLKTSAYLKGLTHYYLERRPKGPIEIEFVVMSQVPEIGRMDDIQNALENALQERDRLYINFLECIRSTVYKAMHDYEDVSVKVTQYDPTIAAFPRDVTRLFSLTKEQWEYEKTKQSGRPNRDADFFIMKRGLDLYALPGLYESDTTAVLLQRWGILNATSVKPFQPIKEGRYWPVPVKEDICPKQDTHEMDTTVVA